ncbi:ribosomal protein S18-alanine N-acetyltransferase [Actinomyces israelii]|uniref:Ribosomal protein S18-alanine N-acetyltransferase n=1 Tax=Actinomyces israelii TaxID=1659 RepID=A0ABT4ICK5_9ACTO|nr:ribosomal protein S18-alanine N-acetyltransferase [Actinomyces israelii]MCZ0859481.1 ribosomal protein S18-alanine N-acetyltransferase [Actinomyces israelii]
MGRHDLGAVARAEALLFGAEAWSPALLHAELAAASGPAADRCYVVVERVGGGARTAPGGADGAGGGELLGYAGLWFGDGDADLLTVATLPAARRRGVATAMIAHLLRRARRAGCTAVLLEVRASNAGAQALYRRLGFAPIGRRRRYYLAPVEDALVMRADTGVRHGAGADSASSAGRAGAVGAVGAEAAADSGAAGRADRAVVGRPPHLSD